MVKGKFWGIYADMGKFLGFGAISAKGSIEAPSKRVKLFPQNWEIGAAFSKFKSPQILSSFRITYKISLPIWSVIKQQTLTDCI